MRKFNRTRGLERLSLALLVLVFIVVVLVPLLQTEEEVEKEGEYVFPPALETSPFPLVVYNHRTKDIMHMDMEEYLVGVVAAEMPSTFHPEALRAQAVTARTYALQKAPGGCENHPQAHICTDHTSCQAWRSREDILNQGGQEALERIEGAVSSTAGLVLTYAGELLDCVYHSTCGGHTAAAHEVWAGSLEYLVGEECGYCSHSPWYESTSVVSTSEFRAAFSDQALPVMSEQGSLRLEKVDLSPQGRAKTLQVGDKEHSAWEFRQRLSLPSAVFDYEVTGDKIIFSLKGYGHGVGMCQYGADGMGSQGMDFETILNHYYRGVEVVERSTVK